MPPSNLFLRVTKFTKDTTLKKCKSWFDNIDYNQMYLWFPNRLWQEKTIGMWHKQDIFQPYPIAQNSFLGGKIRHFTSCMPLLRIPTRLWIKARTLVQSFGLNDTIGPVGSEGKTCEEYFRITLWASSKETWNLFLMENPGEIWSLRHLPTFLALLMSYNCATMLFSEKEENLHLFILLLENENKNKSERERESDSASGQSSASFTPSSLMLWDIFDNNNDPRLVFHAARRPPPTACRPPPAAGSFPPPAAGSSRQLLNSDLN